MGYLRLYRGHTVAMQDISRDSHCTPCSCIWAWDHGAKIRSPLGDNKHSVGGKRRTLFLDVRGNDTLLTAK